MRIAVNTRFLLKGKLEGLGWYSHEILRRLVRNHPEDTFYFLFDRPYDASFIYGANVVPVVLFPPARHPILWSIWFEWSVKRVLKKIQPDVFFSPDSYLSLGSKAKTVLTVHDLIPLEKPFQIPFLVRKYYQYFFPKYVARAEHIIAITATVKSDIIRLCNKSSKDVSVIYNGVREEFHNILTEEKEQVKEQYSNGMPYLFYTGSINKRKNITRLIEAFDDFKTRTKSTYKLLLAGKKGKEIKEMEEAFHNAKWKEDIIFLGYVENKEQVRLMAAATLFVYLSLDEGFGLPLLEAMKCEVPVCASDIPVFKEVAGESAFYVNPKEINEISAKFEQLISDSAFLKSKMAAAAIQVGNFSWDVAAEEVYKVLVNTAG